MTGRGWAAALLLFAVLFVHGLQCDAVADGAAHPGADPMVVPATTAATAGEAYQADACRRERRPPPTPPRTSASRRSG
jgi:hypothetical protein